MERTATRPCAVGITPGRPTACVAVAGVPCECARCDAGPLDMLRAENLFHGVSCKTLVTCYEHCEQHGMEDAGALRLQHACLLHLARMHAAGFTDSLIISHAGEPAEDLGLVCARLWHLENTCKPLDVRTFAAMRGTRFLMTDDSGTFRQTKNRMTARAKRWLRFASLHGDVDTTVVLAESAGVKKNMGILEFLSLDRYAPSPKAALLCAAEHAKRGRHVKAFMAARRAIRCENSGQLIDAALAVEARERCIAAIRAMTN